MNRREIFLTLCACALICGCAPGGRGGENEAKPPHPVPAADPASEPLPPVGGRSDFPDNPRARQPFEERDPARVAQRRHIVDAIWATPLGQMYLEYVFKPLSQDEIPYLSRQLADRAFQEPRLVVTRIAALQLLTEDLYAHGKLHGDASARVLLLEGEFSKRRLRRDQLLDSSVVFQAAGFLLFSLPFGSPMVRKESANVGRFVAARLKTAAGVKSKRTYEELRAKINLGRLASWDVLRGYKVSKAVNVFFNTYGSYTVVYFFIFQWAQTAGVGPEDNRLLYGLDDLLDSSAL
jgi:hypothetical protein